MVYKICHLNDVPRIKLSEEPEKTTIPAKKVVIRAFNDGTPLFDVLCLDMEKEAFL
jgi:nicotinic acid phosphoribosyltransferase